VTSLATLVGVGAVTDFNLSFVLLQIPLGIIGVPLGIVLLRRCRATAVGRDGVRRPLTRACACSST
jgi:peptidoglycan biosynthesis protein MviN/MurJ (putative lipid II flippase)